MSTSRMEAITNPTRWGLERVGLLFGEVYRTRSQTILRGDLVRNKETGELGYFMYREGTSVEVAPIS